MPQMSVHCTINEDIFSVTVFLTRFLVSLVLIYVAAGGLLYFREFLFNAAAIGWPMPITLGISLLVIQLALALLLMLGWFTRLVSGLSIFCMGAVGVVFFASDLNKLYVALMILLITALLPSFFLTPGKISLDYTHAFRRAKNFRG